MKRIFVLCTLLCVMCAGLRAFGAASVLVPKKADSVAKRETSTSVNDLGSSLLPTAVGLVGNVMALSQQQKALTAECEPTTKEITFVNNMVKEWAIAGAANPLAKSSAGIRRCEKSNNETYESSVRNSMAGDSIESNLVCYDVFTDTDARGAVWAEFPKAAIATYCPGSNLMDCAKSKQKKVTNMWNIFDMINFDEDDYTKSELSQATALRAKAANCAPSKLAAKKLETYGGFVTSTIGNMGQSTNSGNVMDAVSGVLKNTGGGGLGNLGGLANVATQFLDR